MITLFWSLLLAHLLGDYPLQSNWLVAAKRNWWGLLLHAGVHLLLLLVVAGGALPVLWPYLLLLATAHLAIDAFKNWLSQRRSGWTRLAYIQDQVWHFVTLVLVAYLAGRGGDPPLLLPVTWVAPLCGLLLATSTWYISERVLLGGHPLFEAQASQPGWPRIVARAALFALFLVLGQTLGVRSVEATAVLALIYPAGPAGRRLFLVDVAIALVVATFILLAPK